MGTDRRGRAPTRRHSDRTVTIVGAGVALVLVVLVASAVGSPIADTPTRDIQPITRTITSSSESTREIPQDTRRAVSDTVTTPGWLYALIAVIFAGVALFVITVVVRWLRTVLQGRRRRHAVRAAVPAVPPAAAAPLLEDVDLHLEALSSGDPDEAIIAMWVAVERSVARAGVERLPSETSGELTLRVLEELSLDDEPVEILAGLYREARFSRHPITDAQRDRARTALTALHDALRRRKQARPDETATS